MIFKRLGFYNRMSLPSTFLGAWRLSQLLGFLALLVFGDLGRRGDVDGCCSIEYDDDIYIIYIYVCMYVCMYVYYYFYYSYCYYN